MDHKEGLLLFLPEMEAQIQPPPLCVSQYALVNYACAFTRTRPSFEDADHDRVYLLGNGHGAGNRHGQNYTQARIQAQWSEDEHGHRNGSSRRHEHEGGHSHRHGHEGGHKHRHEREGGHNHRPRHEGGHSHRHEHEGGHNHRYRHEGGHNHRYRHEGGHNHRHEHQHRSRHEHEHGSRHRRRHRSHHHHEDECCKWLNELDDICVCNLLVRLPPFLSRLQHKYSIRAGDTCKVSFKCEGRRL